MKLPLWRSASSCRPSAVRRRSRQSLSFFFHPTIEALEQRQLLAIFAVINAEDSGPGSLRQAILDANATPEMNSIEFNISPGGHQTIRTFSRLPTITRPVVIDGTSQPGYTSAPLIELTGDAGGLSITAGNSTVRGMIINNVSRGIDLEVNGGNVIVGNYLGTDFTGRLALGDFEGVTIIGSANNRIGGTTAGERNLISGNTDYGIRIQNANNNIVEGNLIGTDITGTSAIPNQFQAVLISGGSNNVIGGPNQGARNIISGNFRNAIDITGNNNRVEGNFIGTDISGQSVLANAWGVTFSGTGNIIGGPDPGSKNLISGNLYAAISSTSSQSTLIQGNWIGVDSSGSVALRNGNGIDLNGSNNTIGGTTPNARNLISGNSNYGIVVSGGTGELIQGNFIGSDITGSVPLGNTSAGIVIASPTTNITIGGPSPGAGNLISANGGTGTFDGGVRLGGSNCLLQGNLVGTDISGSKPMGNNGFGISIGCDNATIGGTLTGQRNVISGNRGDGVSYIGNHGLIQGNIIGTDISGTIPIGNEGYGIYGVATIGGTTSGAGNLISANGLDGIVGGRMIQGNLIGTDITGSYSLGNSGNGIRTGGITTVGGTEQAARNLISGNHAAGILLDGMHCTVLGNYIGVDMKGTKSLGNRDGVVIGSYLGSADNNTIGGAIPGSGNLISGNFNYGISIRGSSNQIKGNLIGTDFTGNVSLGDSIGIFIFGTQNTIGGSEQGARNVISGNRSDGVLYSGSSGNQLLGNFIGTNISGTNALPNNGNGVSLSHTGSLTIGGTSAGAGNVISGNSGSGIFSYLTGGSVIRGNRIGTDITGTIPLGNLNGIFLVDGTNTIGGTASQARNIISGNRNNGITISQGSTNIIQGNYIGTDAMGTAALANMGSGIEVDGGRVVLIGGTASGAGNLISGNSSDGVILFTDTNSVQGNKIGTTVSGTEPLGNQGHGLHLVGPAAFNNQIGGTVSGSGNSIGFNGADGILVDHGTSNNIRRNAIFRHDNGLGIDLFNGGNHDQEFPSIVSAISDGEMITIEGTLSSAATTTFAIEFFLNSVCSPSGFGEGETYLGTASVTTDAEGNADFSLTLNVSVGPGQFITATATNPIADTSSFSQCQEVFEPYLPRGQIPLLIQALTNENECQSTQKSDAADAKPQLARILHPATALSTSFCPLPKVNSGPVLRAMDLFFRSLPNDLDDPLQLPLTTRDCTPV